MDKYDALGGSLTMGQNVGYVCVPRDYTKEKKFDCINVTAR
jgi:hypothetical protein